MNYYFSLKPPSFIFLFLNNTRKLGYFITCVGLLLMGSSYSYGNETKPTTDNAATSNTSKNTNDVLNEQRYTGSLLSPSGAVTQAGLLAIEPYFQSTISRGAYLSDGSVKNNKHRTDSADSFLLIKYGITNKLTLQLTPQVNYYWNGKTTSSSIHFSDLPVDLQYRWIDQIDSRYQPSLSTFLGVSFPTGDYDQLGRSLDANGSGQYTLRFGLQSQAAYEVFHRALRFRWWGVARKPLASRNVKGISNFGTSDGYEGNVRSGLFGNYGFSAEYGLTKEWVLAFDFQYDWAKGTRIKGSYPNSPFMRNVTGASHDIQLAPAVEYNFTPNVGVIAGASVTVDGHNTNDFVQPQMAVNIVF